MTKQRFFITTAIDYPNGAPHLGHAYEKVITDCYARWYRLLGRDVFFLTGTDENGQKLSKSAEKAGQDTMTFVDANVAKFRQLCADLMISFDDFIRTTEKRHETITQDIWKRLEANGDIYLGRYQGNYCLACEAFYTDSQAKDKKCPVHETPLTYTEEEGYFFRLGNYQEWITQYLSDHPQFLFPSNIRTELLSRLNGEKLQDLSISRPNQGWGIKVPGNEGHVIYTWFDALINYLAATLISPDGTPRTDQRWPADVHVIGKDIIWFHAVIWPAMLKSAGYELPKQVYVHGMVLGSDGKRMSKSLGNGVDPQDCLRDYPLDSFRYYMLRAIQSGQDGAFSTLELARFHNSDLANEYGNLLMRVAKLSITNFGEVVTPSETVDFELDLLKEAQEAMDAREHNRALNAIWSGVKKLNAYINQQEPWKKKGDKPAMHRIMYTALLNLNHVSALLSPFIPGSAAKALDMLGGGSPEETLSLKHVAFRLREGTPLFPRIEITTE